MRNKKMPQDHTTWHSCAREKLNRHGCLKHAPKHLARSHLFLLEHLPAVLGLLQPLRAGGDNRQGAGT
jgi:hypothetical protein